MIKATLSYNPYILETKATFNDKNPHINSLIEKYKDARLQDWIKEVPRVFYEELNGYDFEVFFQGTKMEFIELGKVFEQSIPSEEKALVTLVKELENRKRKLDRIDKLFIWLRDSECDYFDFDTFCSENNESINVSYPVLIINGDEKDICGLEGFSISKEFIDDISTLEHTNLRNIPLIIFVDEESIKTLRKDLVFIRSCKNIYDEQLFFIVRNDSKKKTIERFLQDLGIDNPLIIGQTDDDKVYDYLNAYPITQHIYDLCKVFDEKVREVSLKLEKEKKNSEIENSNTNEKIEIISGKIDKIDGSIKRYALVNNFIVPTDWISFGDNLMKTINKFKEAHTVFVGKEVAEREANNYQALIEKSMTTFFNNLDFFVAKTKKEFDDDLKNIFICAEINEPISLKISSFKKPSYKIPNVKERLLASRVDKIVEEKSIFAKKDEPPKKILRQEYYLTNWRKIVSDIVSSEISRAFSENQKALEQYRIDLIDNYVAGLNYHKKIIISEKNAEIENLSDDAKRLEKNSNWVKTFRTMVDEIERK